MASQGGSITVSKRALTLSGGAVTALFATAVTLGQTFLSQQVAAQIEPYRTEVSAAIAELRRDSAHDRTVRAAWLRAIIAYQLEADRYLRSTADMPPRPPELDGAAARLRALVDVD